MSDKRIAVVGGGAAGLSAAWQLRAGGAEVVLYEAQPVTGGLLCTTMVGSAKLDPAVQLLSSTYTRLFALCSATGAHDLLVRASGRDALWRKGRAHEITYGSVPSMIASGALPTVLKLKLGAKYVPYLTTRLGELDANDPAGTGGTRWDDESIATWGHREIGEDFVEYLTYPLLAAYYGSAPESTTAALYHALARVGMEVEVYAARGGMGALAAAITKGLRSEGVAVEAGVAVSDVRRGEGEAWSIRAADRTESFDGVVVAVPPGRAAALLSEADVPALSEWLAGAGASRAATLGLVLEGNLRAGYFGLSFPRIEPPGDRIVAIAVQRNKPADLVPAGVTSLTIFPAASVVPQLSGMTGDEAAEYLGPSIEQVFPGATRRIQAAQLNEWPAGYRSLAPGMIRRIQALRGLALPPGLAVAGDYTMAPTVEGAVRSGERAAAALLTQDEPARRSSRG